MGVLDNIEPREVFRHFEALSMVPRRTYRDEKISAFCVEFAKEHGLDYVQEETGNVIIYKPGTPGYEDSEPVILQGHMDMVAAKTDDSDHDFDNDPLDLFVDGDYIGARGTTLGADDGFALAFAMAVLESTDIPHPPIEAVFTVDEEIGMDGANNIDTSLLKGRKFFNLDGEDEGVLTVGCAGAAICDAVIPVSREDASGTLVKIVIRGYKGGHSGFEIDKQRGNAHKDMGRMLYALGKTFDFSILHIDGGSGANVIAKSCTAEVVVESSKAEAFAEAARAFCDTLMTEYSGQEPDAVYTAEAGAEGTFSVMDKCSGMNVVRFLYEAPDGLLTMEREVEGAIETSLNTGIVTTAEEDVRVRFQCRSSVASKLEDMKSRLELWCGMLGGQLEIFSEYPAWPYNPDSKLRPLMMDVYKKMYGEEPIVVVTHAGLEGGIMMGKKPDLDIVSLGPNLKNVHTPDERIDIPSTQRTWEYFKAVLAACK